MPPARKGYEKRDANAKWIWGIIGFLLVFGLAIHFILAGMLSSLLKTPTPSDRWRPIEPASAALVPAAFPRLQVSPPQDLRTFRAREEEELHGFGWVNRTSGVVRLPIEQAMELVLKEGLPTRAGSNAPQAGPSEYQLIQQRPEHREPEIQGEK